MIRIAKPPVNSLGAAVRKGINDGLDKALSSGAAAVVISGDGMTFPAGADITEFATGGHNEFPNLPELNKRLLEFPMHTVAAVHGTALGGGMELALSCQYRLMHEKARFGLPEVHLGLLPGAGGTQLLPRVVNLQMAIEMMTTGKMIDVHASLASGLADELVAASDVPPDDAVHERGYEFASVLADRPFDESRVVSKRPVSPVPTADFFAKARAAVNKAARGEVAPGVIVGCVEAAATAASFEEGWQKVHARSPPPAVPTAHVLHSAHVRLPPPRRSQERDSFVGLAAGPQSRALVHVFTAERQIGKIKGLPKEVKPARVTSAAVVGSGTMGGGIAMCFAQAGIDVTIVDTSAEVCTRSQGLAACMRVCAPLLAHTSRRERLQCACAAPAARHRRWHVAWASSVATGRRRPKRES